MLSVSEVDRAPGLRWKLPAHPALLQLSVEPPWCPWRARDRDRDIATSFSPGASWQPEQGAHKTFGRALTLAALVLPLLLPTRTRFLQTASWRHGLYCLLLDREIYSWPSESCYLPASEQYKLLLSAVPPFHYLPLSQS